MSYAAAVPRPAAAPSSSRTAPRGVFGRLYQHYFGTAEARSTHIALLTHTALFVATWLLIARQGEAVVQSHTPILTQQQTQQAASMPLQPPGAPGGAY